MTASVFESFWRLMRQPYAAARARAGARARTVSYQGKNYIRDNRPPGDPWNNPEDRKAWEQQGWVIERETAFKKTPENGWIDLTQPLPTSRHR